MQELIDAATSPLTLLMAVILFSLVPGVALHLGVLLYPNGHPRRAELTAELKIIPRWQRPFWVGGTLIAVAFEGVPLQYELFKRRRRRMIGRGGWRTINGHRVWIENLGPWHSRVKRALRRPRAKRSVIVVYNSCLAEGGSREPTNGSGLPPV